MSNIETLPSAISRCAPKRNPRPALRDVLRDVLRDAQTAFKQLSKNIQRDFKRFQEKVGFRAVRYWLAEFVAYLDSEFRYFTSVGGVR